MTVQSLKDRAEGLLLRLQALNVPGDLRNRLRITPLMLTVLAVVAVLGVGGTSMFGARITMEIHELVEVQSLDLDVTTHTTETLPRASLGSVHTYGKDYAVKFMISNSSAELSPYFEILTVTVRLEASGGGWEAETLTSWSEGTGASTGVIVVSPEHGDYALYVTVLYGSKDQSGSMGVGLSVWAEG